MKANTQLLMAWLSCLTLHRAAAQIPFTLSTLLTNGTVIRSVTTMDVNNDGRPDLIAVRGNPSFLYVWTNSGNGFFISNASYAVGAHPNQVIAADVNNDGKLDLITAKWQLADRFDQRRQWRLRAGLHPVFARQQPAAVRRGRGSEWRRPARPDQRQLPPRHGHGMDE